jgi:hypothetical protein
MGIKLNVAKTKFIRTIMKEMCVKASPNWADMPKRIIKPKNNAIHILDSGPATATIASPHFWFLRLYGLKGTGFAQPIINPPRK